MGQKRMAVVIIVGLVVMMGMLLATTGCERQVEIKNLDEPYHFQPEDIWDGVWVEGLSYEITDDNELIVRGKLVNESDTTWYGVTLEFYLEDEDGNTATVSEETPITDSLKPGGFRHFELEMRPPSEPATFTYGFIIRGIR